MATIHDIARAAGVSTATVSRSFNATAEVHENTRQRVLAVARSLNYRPQTHARNLRRRRDGKEALTYSIGALFGRGTALNLSRFNIQLVVGLEEHLQERGFALRMIHTAGDSELPVEIIERRVDGVICCLHGELMANVAQLLPTVALDAYTPALGIYSLVPDYRSGVHEATRLLLRRGHRHVAVGINPPGAGPQDAVDFTGQTALGFRQAHEEIGVPSLEQPFVGAVNSPERGYRMMRRLLDEGGEQVPDALIASDGAMLGIYRAVLESGLRIPADISMIGIDGIPEDAYFHPSLSAIDVHIPDLAQRAVERIVGAVMHGERRQGMDLIPTTLIPRESIRS